MLWTMTICALALPVSMANPTQAESETSAAPAQATPTFSALSTEAASSPDSQPAILTPPVVAAPVPVAPISAPAISAPTATPLMALTAIVAGETQHNNVVSSANMTVGQALAAMNIALSSLDRVAPEAQTPVKAGMTIRVTRIKAELKTRRESVPAQVRYQPTTKLKAGTKQTIQYPRAGYNEITEKVWSKDGKVSSRQFVSKKLGQAPQHQIVALGVNSQILPSSIAPHRRYAMAYRGGSPRDRAAGNGTVKPGISSNGLLHVVRTLKVMTTGYAAGRAGGSIGNSTATGVRCVYGAIAVDPRVIPLGSKLYVEGYGYGFACDIGGAIKGNHIDLAFDSARAANNHGKVRGVTVYILGE